MEKRIINQAGNWSAWSLDKKQALTVAGSNHQIGEKVVYENDEFRIWSIHLPAGEQLPFHKHARRYFWTALSAGNSRSYQQDGSIVETIYESGDTHYFKDLTAKNCFIHNLENIGSTTLIFTTVEFLK